VTATAVARPELSVTDRVDPRAAVCISRELQTAAGSQSSGGVTRYAAGVVAAQAVVGGVPAVLFATDGRPQGAALGTEGCDAVVTAYRHALLRQQPVIGIWQSGGAWLGEGAVALDGDGRIFSAMTAASGRVLQLSLIVGAAGGRRRLRPGADRCRRHGPRGQGLRHRARCRQAGDRGGRRRHLTRRPGGPLPAQRGRSPRAAHRRGRDRLDPGPDRPSRGLGHASFTPSPQVDPGALPESRRRAYDVRPVLRVILDTDAPSVGLHPDLARNIVTDHPGAAGRRSIGVVAGQPLRAQRLPRRDRGREGGQVRAAPRRPRPPGGQRGRRARRICPVHARSRTVSCDGAPNSCTPTPRRVCRSSP